MPIHVSTKHLSLVGKRTRGAANKAIILTKRVLEMGMDQVKGSVQLGDFFDDASGELQTSLWAGEVALKGGRADVEGGWTSIVGPVREFGVRPMNQAGWWIRAKWAKFLRFRVGNSIVYKKEVWHAWTDDQMRPHWGPTIDEKWPGIARQLDQVPAAALRNPN